MGFRLFACIRLVLITLFCVPAGAAVLPAAGTFQLQIGSLAHPVISGTGSASSLGGPGTAHSIPAGFFGVGPTQLSAAILPTFITMDHLTIAAAVQTAAGSFFPGGAMHLVGSAALRTSGGVQAGTIPLSPVGGGGNATFVVGPLGGTLVGATFQGAGGTAPVTFMQSQSVLGIPMTLTATAFDNRTNAGLGTVQLVAPATGSFGILGGIPIFGVVQIQYTPEPGTWLLLGGGLVLLGVGVGQKKAPRKKQD